MTVKRIDRTVQMMRELDSAAADALEEAALKLKTIARQMVSRKFTKKGRRKVFASSQEEAEHKAWVRKRQRQGFLNLPPKKKRRNRKQADGA